MIRSVSKIFSRVPLFPSRKLPVYALSKFIINPHMPTSNSLFFQRTHNFSHVPGEIDDSPEIAQIIRTLTGVLEQGKTFMKKGNFSEAEKNFRKALDLGLGVFGESGEYVGACFYSLGQALALKGERNKAREPYLKAYEILARESEKNIKHLIIIERDLSIVGQEFKMKPNELKDAKRRLQAELNRALADGNFENNAKRIGNIYNSLGSISKQEGATEEAISFKQKSLEWLEKASAESSALLVFVYLDLATFYRDSGHHNEALESINKAIKLVENDKLDIGIFLRSLVYHNLGKLYIMMKDHEKALGALQKATEIKETSRIKDEAVLRRLRSEVAVCYLLLRRTQEAIQTFEKALALPKSAGDEKFVATIYEHIGKCYLLEKNPEKSKESYKKAFELRSAHQGKDHPDTKALEATLKGFEAAEKGRKV